MREEQRDEMKETGGLDLDGIHIMTIIGEIEGHQNAAQGTKTTKYEHMIPDLARVEQDDRIRGVLILINTIGGDVECGLALAELIASLSKLCTATVFPAPLIPVTITNCNALMNIASTFLSFLIILPLYHIRACL